MTSSDTTPSNPIITPSLPFTGYPPSGRTEFQSSDPAELGGELGGEEQGGDGQGGSVSTGDVVIEMQHRQEAGPEVINRREQQYMNDKFVDPSETIWPMYFKESEKEDKNLIDNITIYTNGVLVFTGLFGAIVTAFIIESYKQLQPPDSGTTAEAALFVHLSLQIAASSNGTRLTFPAPINLDSSSFRPLSSALRVNILWFISLSLSLSCALGAALMQQ
ncbi:hypothetical protein BV25DRAFT_619976 [Artomyces pyxidatus]|uniref:Uncharacterized protein n=1 Tax=Artomyces pyxidatus TaxID=48021 RepID=A0ACB8T316_9AGAM|nr:hypothetical protein BV25DRAFT_619976 [Artomyces pyxidatus]